VRLNLYDTSMCFVCAHLAAGQSNVVRRVAVLMRCDANVDQHGFQEERNDNWRDATAGIVFATRQYRTVDKHELSARALVGV
jgi:hypothetical protein